jgi:hypothetical protein
VAISSAKLEPPKTDGVGGHEAKADFSGGIGNKPKRRSFSRKMGGNA